MQYVISVDNHPMTVTSPFRNDLLFPEPKGTTLVLHLKGNFTLSNDLPQGKDIEKALTSSISIVSFETEGLTSWDTGLIIFLKGLDSFLKEKGIAMDRESLPQGVLRILALSAAVPEKKGSATASSPPLAVRAGERFLTFLASFMETLDFLGGIIIAFGKLFSGKARFRASDMLRTIQECGVDALPIVSLISILVGLILAFVGSIQLKMFGAQIYIADLVAIAMTRAMGGIMTGIIMAGRTGASFAARIGTMQVNEEIDALKTAGISPMEFLVLPRMIALALMLPLLTLYADLMGVLGGLIVAVGGFDMSLREYYNETRNALTLTNLWIGLFSSFVFGILVAFAGCLRGIQCGRSASAVGDATTSAVVTGIVCIIVSTAIITIICSILGI